MRWDVPTALTVRKLRLRDVKLLARDWTLRLLSSGAYLFVSGVSLGAGITGVCPTGPLRAPMATDGTAFKS